MAACVLVQSTGQERRFHSRLTGGIDEAEHRERHADRVHEATAFFSDTGTRFRSYAILGSLACHFLQSLRPQITEIAVTYGPESHSKNRCDVFFSELRQALKQQSSGEKDVLDETDLVACYTTWFEYRRSKDPTKQPTFFKVFEPNRARHEVRVATMKPATLPAPLRGCHRWTMRCNDKRRPSLLNSSNQLTAVDVSCTGYKNFGLARHGMTKLATIIDTTGA